jgi:uncharacterized Zn finger protein (UPF0148 family)
MQRCPRCQAALRVDREGEVGCFACGYVQVSDRDRAITAGSMEARTSALGRNGSRIREPRSGGVKLG